MSPSPTPARSAQPGAARMLDVLATVPDPRARRGVRHPAPVVLGIAIAAVIAGARSFTAIGEWATEHGAVLLAAAGLHGRDRPSESAIRRLLTRLDADVLDRVIGVWMFTRTTVVDGRRVIAIDGKTVRGARTRTDTAPHLVAAFDHAAGSVLGQLCVAAKSNEIPCVRDLLALFDLNGVVVTVDAMHTQTDTATAITAAGGDYVFTVKGNTCATRRSDGYPPQAGGTRREVPGSDSLPGAERRRGQQHVRKPAAGPGVPGTARWEDPHGMAKAGLLEPQSPAAATYCDRNGTCNRCS